MDLDEHLRVRGIPAELSEGDKAAIAAVVADAYMFGNGMLMRAADGSFSRIDMTTVRVTPERWR
jgi:hypothetical protein